MNTTISQSYVIYQRLHSRNIPSTISACNINNHLLSSTHNCKKSRNIYFYLLVCLCRLMSLFSSLCVCCPGGVLTQTVSQLLGGAGVVQRVAVFVFPLTLSLFLSLSVCFSQAGRLLDSCFRIPPLKRFGVSPLCFAPPFSACSTCPCLSVDGGVEIQFSCPL